MIFHDFHLLEQVNSFLLKFFVVIEFQLEFFHFIELMLFLLVDKAKFDDIIFNFIFGYFFLFRQVLNYN